MELLHAGPHEVPELSRKHRLEHSSPDSSRSTEAPRSPADTYRAALDVPGDMDTQSVENGEPLETPKPLETADPPNEAIEGESQSQEASLHSNLPVHTPETGESEDREASNEARVVVPPLQLGELRPPTSNVKEQYPTPADSNSATSSPAAPSAAPTPAEENSESAGLKDVHECVPQEEEEFRIKVPQLPSPLIDIVFVFDPEPEDLLTPDQRVLQEDTRKTPSSGALTACEQTRTG